MNNAARLSSPFQRIGTAYVVLGLSLALTLVGFFHLRAYIKQKQRQRFEQAAKLILESTQSHLDSWLMLVKGVRGLLQEGPVPPKILSTFFQSVDMQRISKETGLHDVGVIWRVTPDIHEKHVEYMRKNGHPSYSPRWEKSEQERFPILHLEYSETNTFQTLGWDVSKDKLRFRAMQDARDSAAPRITAKTRIYLPNDQLGEDGFILYLPFYERGIIPHAVEERRELLTGFVFASFQAEKLFAQIAAERENLVDFEIFDDEIARTNLLYDHNRSYLDDHPTPGLTLLKEGEYMGRRWIFRFSSLPALTPPLESQLPFFLLASGLTISFLFFGVAAAQGKGRQTAEKLTRELRSSEKALLEANAALEETLAQSRAAEQAIARSLSLHRATLESTADGILVVDQHGKIVSYNQQFVSMWRIPPEIIAVVDDRQAIQCVLDQLVDPEAFQQKVGELYAHNERESYDMVAFKDGRIFERYSRPQRVEDKLVGRVWSFRDVTARWRAQAALEQSERKYRDLVETSHDLIWSLDEEGRWSFVNSAAKKIYGYDPEEMIGKSFTEFQRAEQASKDSRLFEQLKAGKPSVRFVTEHLRKTGDKIWLSMNARALLDKEGRFFGVTGTARDITEQRKSEERLQDSEALYHSLVENLPQSIFRKDLEGRYTFVNTSFAMNMFASVEELIGKTVYDFYPEPVASKFAEDDRKVLRTGQIHDEVFLLENRMGEKRYVHQVRSPLYDSRGELVGVQGIFWDVTEQRLAEEHLAREKERLAVTLRSIGDAVVTTDTEGKIVLMNPVAEEISGWAYAKAAGEPLEMVFPFLEFGTHRRIDKLTENVLTGGAMARHARYLLVGDERELIINGKGTAIRNREGEIIGAVFVFQNVTEAFRLEAELQKSNRLESLGFLAGGIAHDFNNILTSVVGNLSLLRVTSQFDAPVARQLEDIERAALRARDLTQQLLTFARGGAPIKEAASMEEIIRDSSEFALRGSSIHLELEFAPDLLPAEVDPGQISQVINNLVINGKQAMPQGGTLRVTAGNVRAGEKLDLPLIPGEYVHVAVRDEGIGISKEHLHKIFDPYFTTKERGNGLGLATAYSIVKRHGGLITVESEPSKGSVFHVYLPAAKYSKPVSYDESSANMQGEGRVLTMDDEPGIRELLCAILKQYGYDPTAVADGKELVEEYTAALKGGRPYKAVIMDLTVPGGMGGKEAMEKLRQIDPEIKAIVSSGYSTDPVMAQYQQHGFMGVVEKPYRVETVARVLAQVLNGRSRYRIGSK